MTDTLQMHKYKLLTMEKQKLFILDFCFGQIYKILLLSWFQENKHDH